MNANEVRQLLRDACRAAGGEARFARRIGVSQQLVNFVLHGVREPRGRILDALNLELVLDYRPKKPPGQPNDED